MIVRTAEAMSEELARRMEPLIAALEGLQRGLIEGRQLYLNETQRVRSGIILSLQSVIAFIQSIPQWQREQLDTPLTKLLVSLEGLQSGQVDPILRFDPGRSHQDIGASLTTGIFNRERAFSAPDYGIRRRGGQVDRKIAGRRVKEAGGFDHPRANARASC